jgi:ASPIC and UnbV/FG-GAP-like repeat
VSAVFADFNGDQLPDLYEVNYLAGDYLTRICTSEALHGPRSCEPDLFPAQKDRLFLNRGDGTFEDVSSRAGIDVPDGKGLGCLAFRLEGDSRLSLFVANDTTANFLFVNVTETPGSIPRFEERGVISGCAYDINGRAQATMGIAADDADGDGLLDLYVTNFYNEYNVLYRQQPGGMFLDDSGRSGLKEPSVPMLGFGTQFLDADLDGWPDLVVANGHIDDFSGQGTPNRMVPQFFSNRGGGRFVELKGETPGEFFDKELLGRGLAKLDWNRDGREDFVISNLDTPATLVTNTTEGAGHSVCLQFRGVDSARDAIGTIVEFTCEGRRRVCQLTAGDGYCATNQRQMVLGLGKSDTLEELTVKWPSGLVQRFDKLSTGREWLLIEGRPEPVERARP